MYAICEGLQGMSVASFYMGLVRGGLPEKWHLSRLREDETPHEDVDVWEKRQGGPGSGEWGRGGGRRERAAVRSARTPDHVTLTVQGRTSDFTRMGTGSQGRLSRESMTWLPFYQLSGLLKIVRLGQGWDKTCQKSWRTLALALILGWSVLSACFLSLCSPIRQGWAVWGAPSCPLPPQLPGHAILEMEEHGAMEPASILDWVLASGCFRPSWGVALCSHVPGGGSLLAFFTGSLGSALRFP